MDIILRLFDAPSAPFWPISIDGWLGWFVFLGLIIWLVWAWRELQIPWNSHSWGIFTGLLVMVILLNVFIGIRLPVGSALSLPNIPQGPRGPALMLLSGIPLLLAGGILGPMAAALLGFLAGALRFIWDTNSIYTSLELALLATFFSFAVRQRFRTRFFTLLREPLIAAFALAFLYVPIFIIDAFLASSGSLATRLDYALAGVLFSSLAVGGELVIGGMFSQLSVFAFPASWGRNLPLQPSPAERSLEARFLFGTGALIVFLLLALLAGDWLVAGNAARQMLNDRLKSTAELSALNIPFFLETGQNLVLQVAQKPELASASGSVLAVALEEQIHSISYFDQMLVYDASGKLIGNYPGISTAEQTKLFPEENAGLGLAFSGILSQTYTIPPLLEGQPARVSYVVAIIDPITRQPRRALVARSNLITNPLAQPLLASLKSVSELGGFGILLDESGRILYHPDSTQIMHQYAGQRKNGAAFFDDTASDGTRNLVYYQPVSGRSWSVVLTVPAQQAQQPALSIAAPLSIMILFLAFIALVSLRLGLKGVTTSLQTLANETVRIAQGQLDHALTVDSVDEVGQLRSSFEQMRVSLQSRLEELNRLLIVSQGVASSLDMQDAVLPVLEAVLANGASSVRIVMPSLDDDAGLGHVSIYALGPNKENFSYLDDQVVLLMAQQEKMFVTNVARSRTFNTSSGKEIPFSLFALPLRHENRNYGVLWAGYDQTRVFSETDIRFLTTLAGHASLAASNYHLFRTAEVGRQRLAAILASTPDPVIVTDQLDRLLLANPAAWQVLGAAVGSGEGQPIEKVVTQRSLLNILQATSLGKLSAEVTLPNGQVFYATASPMLADGRPVGRVCILRDVTHFKELDTMKTEFVSTVSHDLRSPLTLIRGYTTMLEMVGTINDQQQGYVKKIINGVENMARLVNNLLDLGRVEAGVGLQLDVAPLFDLLDRVIGPLQLLAVQKNIELTVVTPKNSAPLIEADQALFQQAMYNLIENAIKYTTVGGHVTICLKIIADEFIFEVQDTGIGIALNDQPRLFEKFFRGGQREAREQKGSGLGLAIVKSIIERHCGKVWLESQIGKGSTFFFQVPLRQPKEEPIRG